MPTPPIFINYRKQGGLGHANTIRTTLELAFGASSVFQDNFSIEGGDAWKAKISTAVKEAKVFLILIHGEDWFTVDQQVDSFTRKRRLAVEEDWVRREIIWALQELKVKKMDLILPLIFPSAKNYQEKEKGKALVPTELKSIYNLQFLDFDPDHLEQSMDALINRIASACPQLKKQQSTSGNGVVSTSVDPLSHLPLPTESFHHLAHLDSPYKGIAHFDEESAALFFGREKEIARLYDLILYLEPGEIMLLHGATGVGKSSLLHAGLLPRMKQQGWKVIYQRRSKEKGLDEDLAQALEMCRETGAAKQLIILDQVEEMLADQGDLNEIDRFFEALQNSLLSQPEIRIMLSFRKEYLADIRDRLNDRDRGIRIPYKDFSVKALGKTGIRKAIHGVFKDPRRKAYFQAWKALDQAFEDQLLKDILQDQSSHIAPLLQYQLKASWQTALQDDSEHICLDLKHYQPEVSLGEFIDKRKIPFVEAAFPNAAQSGLINDILHYFTTHAGTAASHTTVSCLGRYKHLEGDLIKGILTAMTDHYLLVRLAKDKDAGARYKLAHDSLAPLLRQRFETADTPGQRAAQLVLPKQRLYLQGNTVSFSEEDLRLIEQGRSGMQALSEEIEARIKEEQEAFDKQRVKRFELSMENAGHAASHLRYEACLENLQLAAREEIQKELVYETALELLFPLHFLDQKDNLNAVVELLARMRGQNVDLLGKEIAYLAHGASKNKETEFIPASIWNTAKEQFFPEMIEVKGGKYKMGSEEGSRYFSQEGPPHWVQVHDFQIASTLVSYYQFSLYCLDQGLELPRDSGFGRGMKPVINVNWHEATLYCNWLSRQQGLEEVYAHNEKGEVSSAEIAKSGYRLPTEAEWEFAARERGKAIRFGNGKDTAFTEEINFDGEHTYNQFDQEIASWSGPANIMRGETTPVGSFSANMLGLYDMSGNVNEWCWDWYDENLYQTRATQASKRRPINNPLGPDHATYKVVRGGSWLQATLHCRCSYRYGLNPFIRYNSVGFRVVRR